MGSNIWHNLNSLPLPSRHRTAEVNEGCWKNWQCDLGKQLFIYHHLYWVLSLYLNFCWNLFIECLFFGYSGNFLHQILDIDTFMMKLVIYITREIKIKQIFRLTGLLVNVLMNISGLCWLGVYSEGGTLIIGRNCVENYFYVVE